MKVILEKNYSNSKSNYDPLSKKTTIDYSYYSQTIQVVSIDASGKLEWVTPINKNQDYWSGVTSNKYSERFSMSSMLKGNDVYVFYMNFNFKPEKGGDKDDYLTAVLIDSKGKATTSLVQPIKDDIKIRYFLQGSKNQIIGNVEGKRNSNKVYSIGVK